MEQKKVSKESFQLIGIKIKTSNEKAMHDIGQHWNTFYSEDIKNKIPNRVGEEVFAVYTEYEGNYTKPYTYIIGCKVSSLDSIPSGMVGMTIESAEYEVFVAKGKMPDNIIETWQHIWEPAIDERRSYKTDFEIYGDKYGNPEDSEVDIYIGLK